MIIDIVIRNFKMENILQSKYIKMVLASSIMILILGIASNRILALAVTNQTVLDSINSHLFKISFIILYTAYIFYIRTKDRSYLFIYMPYILALIIIYILYRFNIIRHADWYFIKWYSELYYSDLFIAAIIITSPWKFKSLESEKVSNVIPNPSDSITTEAEDKFGYYADTAQFLERIISNKNLYENSSLVIGLIGAWGMGKTSYLNMLAEYAKINGGINVVKFNPWQSNSYEQMTVDFFTSIRSAVGENLQIQKNIDRYTQAIVKANIGTLSKIISALSHIKTKSLQDQFDELNSKIKANDNLILVLIDDLDRLNKEEILNVFKLMRVNANFGKVIFIVAYDSKYVKRTLSPEIKDIDSYLEKIFPCPYNLPHIPNDKLVNHCKDLIEKILILKTDDKKHIATFFKLISNNITMRNSARVANRVAYSIGNLKDDNGDLFLNLSDYLTISYIQIIAPGIYEALQETLIDRDCFFDFDENNLLFAGGNSIELNRYKSIDDYIHSKDDDKSKLTVDEYIERKLSPICGTSKGKQIYSILEKLFIADDSIGRISDKIVFPLFFERCKSDKILTMSEFDAAWNKGSSFFVNRINQWLEEKEHSYLHRIIANINFTEAKDWARFFQDITSSYPYGENTYLLVIPGQNTFVKIDNDNRQAYSLYISELKFFLENIEENSLAFIERKFAMLNTNFIQRESRNLIYIKKQHKSIYEEYEGIDFINIRVLTDLYVRKYLEMVDSYENFNRNFWFRCHEYHDDDRRKFADPFLKHIELHIDSFMKHHHARDFSGSILSSLFKETAPRNYSADRSIYDVDKNIPAKNFIAFLNSIKNPNKKLKTYIEEVSLLIK